MWEKEDLHCWWECKLMQHYERQHRDSLKTRNKTIMCCAVLSHSVMSNSLPPCGLQPTRLLCPWGFSRQEMSSARVAPNSGIKHRSPALQIDFVPAEPTGKPKNTGMGSLSLLQQVFLTSESNQDLLHPELLQTRSSTDCVELNTTPSKRQDWK